MTARSLHIGLNHISPAHYGSDQALKNPVRDATAMKMIADAQGFDATVLLDTAATVATVASEISDAAAKLKNGDIFFISYAGHGSQLFDSSGDEPDSMDETWCLYDRMIIDDELYGLYQKFKPGVRLLIVSDSCHSATVARGRQMLKLQEFQDSPPIWPDPFGGDPIYIDDEMAMRSLEQSVARSVFLENAGRYREVKALAPVNAVDNLVCSLILLAACQDSQLAADGPENTNGYFTSWLRHFWADGAFAGSYHDLFEQLKSAMPRTQKPNLLALGLDTDAFGNQRPFSL